MAGNICPQGFRYVASFDLGGQESASKPPQVICKPLTAILIETMKLIFDSNVFDDLITGKLDLKIVKSKSKELYITHIQVDELNECEDKEKRALLFNFMIEIRPEKIATESFIIGTSRIGSAKIGDGDLIEN
ncbi:hypothetical protein [Flavobacterium sp. U410]